jgi:Arc/MetJ-type ribon-helix-helix transcriptional regulator
MTNQVPVRLSDEDLQELDRAVAQGLFRNRSEALRRGLALLLKGERDRTIAEAYRRGYGEHPQEESVGRAGLALLAASVEAEERGREPL